MQTWPISTRSAMCRLRVGERLIRLGDVAEVVRGYEDPPSYLVQGLQVTTRCCSAWCCARAKMAWM